jgi:DNA polymerase-3 subunit epsilon
MDFISIDFETSNHQQSPCAIGCALVHNNVVTNEYYTLINPSRSFSRNFTAVHGITANDVVDAPFFPDVWKLLGYYFSRYPIVAHNASFEKDVLEKATRRYKIRPLPIVYYCTMELYKHNYPSAEAFNLPAVCNALSVTLNNHHNALEDARATAHVMISMLSNEQNAIFPTLVSGIKLDSPAHEKTETKKAAISSFMSGGDPEYIKTSAAMDVVSGILFDDATFVITGAIPGYDRAALEYAIIQLGGKVTGSVTKKTNYVVVGLQDVKVVKDGAGAKSSKILKAEEMRNSGVDIKIISADDFLNALKERAAI